MTDAQTVGLGLTTPIAQGDWRLMFLQHDRIKDVTPEDLVRVAKAYFKASNRRWAYFIPDPAPDRTVVPETPDLAPSSTITRAASASSQGEAFDPTPANIEKRVLRSQAGERNEGGDAAQEDGEQHGVGGHRAALRRRAIACWQERRGAVRRRHC